MKWLGGGLGLVIIVVLIGLVIRDVTSTPPATKSQCILQRNILLPDRCVTGCALGIAETLCIVATRPYAIFFTQAAACADGLICGSGGHRAPRDPSGAGLTSGRLPPGCG
jgi:hypothetical protein